MLEFATCNNNDIEDEYHFILECSKYIKKIAGYGHHIYTYRNDILAILQTKKLPHLKRYL
jgi:hypothetical protein